MNHCPRLFCFLFAFLSFFGKIVNSQSYYFENYSVQDGLAQSNITSIVQDKNGYVWLGTESGVSRFDGKKFHTYTSEDGLADNSISAMLLDKKGDILFAHNSGRISRYNGGEFTVVFSDSLLKNRTIYSLYEDNSGKIWMCTKGMGAVVINASDKNDWNGPSSYQVYRGKEGLSEYVFSVFQDSEGTYWFVTDVGIKRYSGKGNFEFFKEEGMPPLHITCAIKDKKGNVWFGTDSEGAAIIVKYNKKDKKFEYFATPAWISFLKETSDGAIWASTWGRGITRIKENKVQQFGVENGLSSNKIYSIEEDREGNVLLGTYGKGLDIFKGERFISYGKNDGIIDNYVRAIEVDGEGNIWLGTNYGFSVLNTKSGKIKNYNEINKESTLDISSLASDTKGNIWISSGSNIYKYDILTSKFSSIPFRGQYSSNIYQLITSIEIDKAGNLWIGTSDGIIVYNINSSKLHEYRTVDGLAGNDINTIYCDKKGNVWIACREKGLTVLDNGRLKTFSIDDGFTHNNPVAIAEDNQGKIWIGTKGGGVYVFENGKFLHYKTENGLVSDYVTAAIAGKNNMVWLGTNKGLALFGANGKIKTYNKIDGFTGLETSQGAAIKDSLGNIWFGTVNGVTKYNPEKDKKNNLEPLLHITKVKVNNKEIPFYSGIELNYLQNTIAFEFIAVCLSNSDQVRYAVMLEGYDKDWKPPTSLASDGYSNLPPGEYTLKIKASNNDDVWLKAPVSMSFYIKSPFWKTWWFIILCVSVGGGLIVSYIKIRERNLIHEKQILEKKVEARTAEVVLKNKELDSKNKDITASIRYAKRIQDAILLPNDLVRKYLPKTFILFKPKDIVSGDFYWIYDKEDIVLFAAVDCTGHGVPGAFMSIVGHNLLDKIVSEDGITQPAAILDALNKSVSDTLRQSQTDDQAIKDGMDLALCSFNRKTNELQYAGAFNPLWLIREGQLMEYKADKFPIGNLKVGEQKKFVNHSIQLQKGDTVYIFSDGYADQFGGEKGKKFKYSALKKLFLETQHLNMEEQGHHLDKTIEQWRGDLEQVDDILVIGTRL